MRKSLIWLAVLSLLLSCGSNPRVFRQSRYNFSGAKNIAVLPFENLSGQEGAGEKVQKIFLVELLKQNKLNVSEPGEVEKSLKELRIRATEKLSSDQTLRLKEKLGIDWLLLGSVLEFSAQRQGVEEIPVVSLTARILDAQSGKIVWAAFESRQGDDAEFMFGIGKVNSASELAQRIAEKLVPTLSGKK